MLNKSENSTKTRVKSTTAAGSKLPTRQASADGRIGGAARTRPTSRSRTKSKSPGRPAKSAGKRAAAKVYTKKELADEKNKLNNSVDIIQVIESKTKLETVEPETSGRRRRSGSKPKQQQQVESLPAKTILDTLHPIDNNYNLLNSPANIKSSSIGLEQQPLQGRYELRHRASPFVAKNEPHLLRNSTPVQSGLKLKLDESVDKQVDSIGLNSSLLNKSQDKSSSSRQQQEAVKKSGCTFSSAICLFASNMRYFLAVFLLVLSIVLVFYYNQSWYDVSKERFFGCVETMKSFFQDNFKKMSFLK